MKLRPIFVDVQPEFGEIKIGDIWISHKHRTINLRCPCGCDNLTILSLHPSRWHVHFDGKSISIDGHDNGSIWAHSGCGSHYFIRKNTVIWANKIDPRYHPHYTTAEWNRMLDYKSKRRTLRSWLGRAWRGLSPRN